ncbi:hemagglutinin repeat-containing protein [Pandoraea terrae]|uniref:hemagglutinin repeat-containing protein n=1 Tax=Pandoraea terrae TaxID=1537710 RepID=UPI001CD31901|nr:hemagglutinin repeat-containing protein [Pandoraea terrae]
MALLIVPHIAMAQIVPDAGAGGSAPGVHAAPNGVPLVDITAPTPGGVSHNAYERFDVGTPGAILNNAATGVPTQLGGWVPGNPNLGGGSAAVIVNEVTSALPSTLNGYLEVAGPRAEVVVANPNGLTCNGCGFINTSRGVLTTGAPVFGGTGSLEAFRVKGGMVRVEGAGFNARNLDGVALLARAIQLNALIHAGKLDLVTGLNEVDAQTFLVRSSLAGADSKPVFGLDISHLGGMYAGKIQLIGTELGVGVNVGGQVAAQEFHLSASGLLTVTGQVHAEDTLSINAAGGIGNRGTISSKRDLVIASGGDVDNAGTLYAAGDVTARIGGVLTHSGAWVAGRHVSLSAQRIASRGWFAAGVDVNGRPGNDGNLRLAADGALVATGRHWAAGDVALQGASLDVSGSRTDAGRNLHYAAMHGPLSMAGARTRAGQRVRLDASGRIEGRINGSVDGRMTGYIDHDGAETEAAHLEVAGASLSNRGGRLAQHGGDARVDITGALDNTGGKLESNAATFTLAAGSLDNTRGTITHAGTGRFDLTSSVVTNTGGLLAGNGAVEIATHDFVNTQGRVTAGSMLRVASQGTFANDDGELTAGAGVHLTAGHGIDNRGGKVSARTGVAITAGGLLDNRAGSIESTGAQGAMALAAQSVDNTDGRIVNTGTGLTRIVADSVKNAVTNAATNATSMSQSTASTTDAATDGATDTAKDATGFIGGNGAVHIVANTLENDTSARIKSGGDLVLGIARRLANSGTLFAGHDLRLGLLKLHLAQGAEADSRYAPFAGTSQLLVHNRGQIQGMRDAWIHAATLTHAGKLAFNGSLALQAAALAGEGALRAGGDLHLAVTGDYTHAAGRDYRADGDLSFTAGGVFTNAGSLSAVKRLSLNAASIHNTIGGQLRGGTTALAATDEIRNDGRIEGQEVSLSARRVHNAATVLGDRITVAATDIVNQGSRAVMAATSALDLWADGDVLNDDGAVLYSLGALRIGAGAERDAQGYLARQTASLTNRSATIEAGGDLDIATRKLLNERSFIHIQKAVPEGEKTFNRRVWVAGYHVDLRPGDAQDLDTNLPTTHRSHSLAVNGEPAFILQEIEIQGESGEPPKRVKVRKPNPKNQSFTQWRWHEAKAALSEEKLQAVAAPVRVVIPKSGVRALDANGKTFRLAHPIEEVYQTGAAWLAGGDTEFQKRTITHNAVQHFERLTDDGQGNYVIEFYPDFDPATHLRPGVVDEAGGHLTGEADEGVRILRYRPGMRDGRDYNEVRREFRESATVDRLIGAAPAASLVSQGAMRVNVDDGEALNDASTIAAGGNLNVRGNGGAITARGIELERRVNQTQTSWVYWHEKRGNSAREVRPYDFSVAQRREVVDALPAIVSSNQRVAIAGRDVDIASVNPDGETVAGTRVIGGGTDGAGTGASGEVDAVNATAVALPDLKLPAIGLFAIDAAPAHPYLVVTDPRFTDYGNFVSSDYLLALLGLDPARVDKRVGDGFYEARLLREQVLKATGRTFLAEHTQADEEFKALMASGATYAREFELRVGVALTAAQMKALTSDIVWLVRQTVTLADGSTQEVLVPKLYLARGARAGSRVRLEATGAVVAGSDVLIEARDTLTNSGRIVSDADVHVAARDVVNTGAIASVGAPASQDEQGDRGGQGVRGNVGVRAERDVVNLGGEIAGRGVDIRAGRDVVVGSKTRRIEQASGRAGQTNTVSNTLVDAQGAIHADEALRVVAQRDAKLEGAQVSAGGDAQIAAGRDVAIGATALEREFGSRGDGAGGVVDATGWTERREHLGTSIDAQGSVTVVAGRDAAVLGSTIASGGDTTVAAAGDVTVGAVKDTHRFEGKSFGGTLKHTTDAYHETVRGSEVQAGGDIRFGAGQGQAVAQVLDTLGVTAYVDADSSGGEAAPRRGDVKVQGSYVNAGRQAGAADARRSDGATAAPTATAVRNHATGHAAGNDAGNPAGNPARPGTVRMIAAGDVRIEGVEERHDTSQWSHDTRSGVLSRSTKETQRDAHDVLAQGSTVSGNAVEVGAARDVRVTGSNVVGEGDVTVKAGRDLEIAGAENRHAASEYRHETTSGVFGNGGGSVTIGRRAEKEITRRSESSHTGSVLGSVTGEVTLVAGEQYRQAGSQVVARAGDVDIAGKRVAIVESTDTAHSEHEFDVRQSGVTVAVSSPVLAAAQTAGQMAKAAGKTSDGRLQALAGATAGLAGKNAYDAVTKDPSALGGINVSVTVGGSRQTSRETQTSTSARGSSVAAGGDIRVRATAGGDRDGDHDGVPSGDQSTLTVRGSDLEAGGDVTLAADGAIELVAAENTSSTRRRSRGASGGIGVGVSIGTKTSVGVTANASVSRGKAEGDAQTWTTTHVTAGKHLTMESGGDTTLRGAQVRGESVAAKVGGDLKLESLQDRDNYHSRDQSLAGSITAGLGTVSGAINASHQQIRSDYASVQQQSGILAGDGGFDVEVKGNTDLVGAVIASTDQAAEAGANRLKTGTLTQRDLENRAEYDAFGVSIGGGFSSGGSDARVGTDQAGQATTGASVVPGHEAPASAGTSGGASGGMSVTPPMIVAAGGSATSTTRSGISAGVIEITDGEKQQAITGKTARETIAETNREVSSERDGSNALGKIFNEQEIKAGFEIVEALQREVGVFVNNRAKEADDLEKARDAETDPARRAQLDARLVEAQKWGPGGDYRRIASAITAAAGGNVTGSAAEMAQAATVNYLQGLGAQQVKALGENLDPASKAALHAIVGCAGGAASSGNCGAGAMGGAAGSLLGSLLAKDDNPGQKLSQQEREARVNLITSIVAGVAAGAGGDVGTTSTGAKTEAENNAVGIMLPPTPPQSGGVLPPFKIPGFEKFEPKKGDNVTADPITELDPTLQADGIRQPESGTGIVDRIRDAVANMVSGDDSDRSQEDGNKRNPKIKDVPDRGSPGSWIDGERRSRKYGPDGKPEIDIDKPHQGYDRPHVHEWPDGRREHPGRDVSPVIFPQTPGAKE